MNEEQQRIRWVETWRRASSSLRDLRGRELRSDAYYDKNRILLDEMLQYACDNAIVRLSSGLVEQQRLFMKLQKSKESERVGGS